MAGPDGFDLDDLIERLRQRLHPDWALETRITQKRLDLRGRVERGLAVEHVVELLVEILFPQLACSIDEADDELAARAQDTACLREHSPSIIDKADRRHGQHRVKGLVLEGKLFCRAWPRGDASPFGVAAHDRGRIDAPLHTQRSGEPASANAHFEAPSFPRKQRTDRQELRVIGGGVTLEPRVVSLLVSFEWRDSGHRRIA